MAALHCTPISLLYSKLQAVSPEAATLVGKRCQQKRWPFPTLWKLPTEIPLIFSYGWLPRNARLVVSEGLLSQLAADEVATLVSYEMAHWKDDLLAAALAARIIASGISSALLAASAMGATTDQAIELDCRNDSEPQLCCLLAAANTGALGESGADLFWRSRRYRSYRQPERSRSRPCQTVLRSGQQRCCTRLHAPPCRKPDFATARFLLT